MNYADERRAIDALVKQVAGAARRLLWNLARATPDAARRRAEARNAKLAADSEAYRRNQSEQARNLPMITGEELDSARSTASTARFRLEPLVPELDQRYRQFVATCRRDTALSFPDALNGITPTGMLTYHLLLETMRPSIEQANIADLVRLYERGQQTKDARALAEATLIEERVDRAGLASKPGDLPLVKHLTELVDFVRDLRVPFEPEERDDIEKTIALGRTQVSMADIAQVRAVNADHPAHAAAKAAFEAEAVIYAEAAAAEG
jgi:hypothetical protein